MKDHASILETIKKVLELSKNNPSAEEAQAAALKAQELLAKYHIEMSEVEDIDLDTIEELTEVCVDVPAKKWKYTLARIVANNFRCRHYYMGKGTVVFFGHDTDAHVAAETFKYLFARGRSLAGKARKQARGENGYADGVYNSFAMGFCAGIEQALGEQSHALMVIVPEDVKAKYDEMSKDFKQMHQHTPRTGYDSTCRDAYNDGVIEGRHAVHSRQLKGE